MLNSIKKNYIYNVSYQIFTLLIPFITTPYISRVLKPYGVGIYSYTNSIATYFSLVAALGIASYGAREVARVHYDRQKSTKLFYELMIIRVAATVLCLLTYVVFVFIFGQVPKYYFGAGLIIAAMMFDCNWFFQAMEDFKMLALRSFLIKIVSVLMIFSFVKTADDLIIYIVIQSGSILVSNILPLPSLRRYLVKVDFKQLRFKTHIKETLIYFIPTIATSVYTILDKTMIGLLTANMNENGFYEQAQKIVTMLLTVITSLTTVVGVRTSFLFAAGKTAEIKQHIRETFRYMCMLAFPLMFGLMACADTFVPWFFGEDYGKVIPLLRMFAPLVLLIGVSNVLSGLYLIPSGQRGKNNKAIIAGALINVVMNLLLIPAFNTYGAVIASVSAELLISVAFLVFSREYISVKSIAKDGIKYMFIALIMALPVYYIGTVMPPTATTTVLQVAVGIAIYFGGLFLMHDDMLTSLIKLLLHRGPAEPEEEIVDPDIAEEKQDEQ